MLCRGDEQESQSSEAVRRIVKVRREGDEETLLGDGGRPPTPPTINARADKLAELIDWAEGLPTLSPVLQSSQSVGLTKAAVKQLANRPMELPKATAELAVSHTV